jgi:peroxiredoxin
MGVPKVETGEVGQTNQNEGIAMMAKVGKPAPDFEASAFIDGGFKNITLSEFKGKWVVLCFYPGDFTFV